MPNSFLSFPFAAVLVLASQGRRRRLLPLAVQLHYKSGRAALNAATAAGAVCSRGESDIAVLTVCLSRVYIVATLYLHCGYNVATLWRLGRLLCAFFGVL